MTVRVNLLKPTEFRRQGAVSGAFVLRTSIVSVLAFATFFALLGMVHFQIARQDLLASQEIWRIRKPLYDQIQMMKADLATEKKLQQELRGWGASRIEWYDPLIQLQKVVPPTLQLRDFSVRGDVEIRQAPAPEPSAEGESGAAAPPAAAPIPMRRFYLTLNGRGTGSRAEDVVVSFVRELGRADLLRSILESIKLASLQRDSSRAGDQADRLFSIEAVTVKRAMK
jgi:hypothetical protein